MVFNDEPILNIIKLLERNYNVKFEIKSDKLNSITFTGTLKMPACNQRYMLCNLPLLSLIRKRGRDRTL